MSGTTPSASLGPHGITCPGLPRDGKVSLEDFPLGLSSLESCFTVGILPLGDSLSYVFDNKTSLLLIKVSDIPIRLQTFLQEK